MGIRLMIVDDHEMVRAGLQTVLELEDDVEVVAEAATGEEAVARVGATDMDVVLMDVLMPGMGGIEACREIRQQKPAIKVLMLTSSSDDEAVLSSLIAGASGYLLKNVGRADLVKAIRLVADGQKTLDPAVTAKVTSRLVDIAGGGTPVEEEGPLSTRECDVICLIARGHTNKQIAEELVIAEKTARNHVSRILDKLGLTRRTQAAAWAIRQGLIDD